MTDIKQIAVLGTPGIAVLAFDDKGLQFKFGNQINPSARSVPAIKIALETEDVHAYVAMLGLDVKSTAGLFLVDNDGRSLHSALMCIHNEQLTLGQMVIDSVGPKTFEVSTGDEVTIEELAAIDPQALVTELETFYQQQIMLAGQEPPSYQTYWAGIKIDEEPTILETFAGQIEADGDELLLTIGEGPLQLGQVLVGENTAYVMRQKEDLVLIEYGTNMLVSATSILSADHDGDLIAVPADWSFDGDVPTITMVAESDPTLIGDEIQPDVVLMGGTLPETSLIIVKAEDGVPGILAITGGAEVTGAETTA